MLIQKKHSNEPTTSSFSLFITYKIKLNQEQKTIKTKNYILS